MAIIFMDPDPTHNDGFDVAAQYHMIPARGNRKIALWATDEEKEDLLVYSADPNKAFISDAKAIRGRVSQAGSGFLLQRSADGFKDVAVTFSIGGRDPGSTVLKVETERGRLRGFLLVSVKAEYRLTYQLCVVRDPIHIPAKELVGANLAQNMLIAEKIWLDQANVRLTRVGGFNDVFVPINLEDPIVIDRQKNYDAIVKATKNKDIVSANLYVYCTWDLVYETNPNVGGSATYNTCFVENQFSGKAGGMLCAHEIGHMLGLGHNDVAQGYLMNALGSGSDLLDTYEIETANRL
jgi:hypothetical protein